MLASRAAARVALCWVRVVFWAALTRPPKFPVSGGDKTVADLFSAPQTNFWQTRSHCGYPSQRPIEAIPNDVAAWLNMTKALAWLN